MLQFNSSIKCYTNWLFKTLKPQIFKVFFILIKKFGTEQVSPKFLSVHFQQPRNLIRDKFQLLKSNLHRKSAHATCKGRGLGGVRRIVLHFGSHWNILSNSNYAKRRGKKQLNRMSPNSRMQLTIKWANYQISKAHRMWGRGKNTHCSRRGTIFVRVSTFLIRFPINSAVQC